jgi:hypothetical protein
MASRRALGVSDPRDMIYAYLGLVDVQDERVAINYDKTVAQTYEDVAIFFILLHVEETESSKRRAGLPSWVPDWTRQ